MESVITPEAMNAYFIETLPDWDQRPEVTAVGHGTASVRLVVEDRFLRPGRYVGGPTQMSVADTVAFVAIATRTGIEPMIVTSNLNMNFLRPLIGEVVEASAEVTKLGRALAVTDVKVWAAGSDRISGHASVTYALPAERTAGGAAL